MEHTNFSSVRDMLSQLPTEKLREMLNIELHNDPLNPDLIQLISNLLKERSKDDEFMVTPGMASAWKQFEEDTEKIWIEERRRKQVRLRILRTAAAAIALFVLLVPVIPQETDAESLWDRLTRWTADVVEFFSPEDNMDRFGGFEFRSENQGLQQVYSELCEMGVEIPAVPMWLPGNPSLMECKVTSTPYKKQLTSCFSDGNNEIIFSVNVYSDDVSHQYHGDGTDAKQYTVGETTFNIIRNNDAWVVVWYIDNIECSIFADCQEDILHRILKSIYVMEEM